MLWAVFRLPSRIIVMAGVGQRASQIPQPRQRSVYCRHVGSTATEPRPEDARFAGGGFSLGTGFGNRFGGMGHTAQVNSVDGELDRPEFGVRFEEEPVARQRRLEFFRQLFGRTRPYSVLEHNQVGFEKNFFPRSWSKKFDAAPSRSALTQGAGCSYGMIRPARALPPGNNPPRSVGSHVPVEHRYIGGRLRSGASGRFHRWPQQPCCNNRDRLPSNGTLNHYNVADGSLYRRAVQRFRARSG